jgi:malate dehydrogenase
MVTPGQARAAAYKVAVLGAAGGIGQPLSLLIKMSPLVSDLHLYDIANVKGVVADLSHCNTPAKVCTCQQGLYQGFQQGGMTH